MKKLVIISGKGGTGKTSLAASFAALAENSVIADYDVDASDLHLLLLPKIKRREKFKSGREAIIRTNDCIACGICLSECRFQAIRAIRHNGRESEFVIDSLSCEGCGVCVQLCPNQAIDFPERLCGEWMVSETRLGPMIHARLDVGAGNSGKLVSIVRKEARKIAEKIKDTWMIDDGPRDLPVLLLLPLQGLLWLLLWWNLPYRECMTWRGCSH